MRKWLLIGAILVIAVTLVFAQSWMVTSEHRTTEPWRLALNSYIAHMAGYFDPYEPVAQVVGAERPRDFRDMDFATYGDTWHFATDQQPEPTPTVEQFWGAESAPVVTPTSVLSDAWIVTPAPPVAESPAIPTPPVSQTYKTRSAAILIYPPSDVRCVQLRQTDGQSRIVFVARHDDLYWSEWVVHTGETTPLSPEFTAFLEQIGCDLNLDTSN
ncbi:MAG: hypothetical protein JXA21_12555 [Anaerolineae bacterium]|nr:hypothetical protein [Anaerolineae bacterium]